MSILAGFYPKTFEKNTYAVDYRDLHARGYRGIIFDIDNTLVPHDAPATAGAALLFKKLKKLGFSLRIVSNNEEERVAGFAKAVGCGYVHKANKPSVSGYLKACRQMKLPRDGVLVIGDQLFTDIWGANRSGLYSILVGRISFHEPFHIHLKRALELPLLLAYFIKHPMERKKLWK